MTTRLALILAFSLIQIAASLPLLAQDDGEDDVTKIPSQDLRAGGDTKKRYFLIGPERKAVAGDVAKEAQVDRPAIKPPKDGFKLLVVMPGGDGSAEFHPFVKRIFANALPDGWLLAQPVAVKWSDEQAEKLVWPTKKSPWKGMLFSTEEFVEAVIADVGKKHKLNPKHVYTLSWSSGGPAAYAISLQDKTAVKGSFIAMSVFNPAQLPPMETAKRRAYYLYQSRGDNVCKFSFAEKAKKTLGEYGANVLLVEYEGGHGWFGDMFGDIRTGVNWLVANSGKAPAKTAEPADKSGKSAKPDNDAAGGANGKPAAGPNLLENGGFEGGLDGWTQLNNSGRAKFTLDKKTKSGGAQALKIFKTDGMPMDVLRRDLTDLPKGGKVKVSARVKSASAKNSFFKFFIYGEGETSLVEDVDVARITGTGDWKTIEKSFDVPENAKSAAVMFVMVLDGTVWLDDVRVEKIEK